MRRRAARAATGLAVAVALLSGCGGGDEGASAGDGGGDAAAARPEAGATPPADGGGAADDDGVPEETVPEEELSPPAGGEFSREQRRYLADRVPEGVDPAAVLQLGQEACDRIGYLARHAPEELVPALREGEIPDAEAAIEHLCPEYADHLAEAQGQGGGHDQDHDQNHDEPEGG